MSSNKKVIVTGGAGFIGSYLCERLVEEGHSVICVDSMRTGRYENLKRLLREPRFELVEQDVIAPPPPLRADDIYHLACPASPPQYQIDPVHTMMTCVVGAWNYLELAKANGARFLFTSTSEVYGDPERHPQAESYRGAVSTTGPRACYDEGKRAAESLVADYHRVGYVNVRIARIFNTYGPRMRPDDGRVVTNFITQALEGRPLTVYGDGNQTRSFCYVDDLLEGIFALMDCDRAGPRPVNLGNPDEFTVGELAEMVIALCGSASTIERKPLPQDDPKRRQPSIRLAKSLLGWRPRTPLREGLVETIRSLDSAPKACAVIRMAAGSFPLPEERRLAAK